MSARRNTTNIQALHLTLPKVIIMTEGCEMIVFGTNFLICFQLRVQCVRKLRPFSFFPIQNAIALCLYSTDWKGKNICVKAIQCDKLWYDFPVFPVSHYGEQAVSLKKVDLPESLLHRESTDSLIRVTYSAFECEEI